MTEETEIPEAAFERMLRGDRRVRMMAGQFDEGVDVADLRAFVGVSQPEFAAALGVSLQTVRAWEQGRRRPAGPALALLRIAARHPRLIRENLAAAVA